MSRAGIRSLLKLTFKSAGDFEAFCHDHFPDVYFLFTTGMNRRTQTNLLLENNEPAEVWAALQKALAPLDVTFFEKLARETSPLRQRDRELETVRRSLATLERERRALVVADPRIPELDAKIKLARSQLRHGPHLNAGELVSDRYRLLESIGSGSFGEVWHARDEKAPGAAPIHVALKVLYGASSLDTKRRERFMQSAALLHKLQHPHIVRASSEASEWQGFYYFVMEYLEGGDLEQAIKADPSAARVRQGLEAVIQAGRALSYLHQHDQRIVHRDVKPSNILLDRNGLAKLSDLELVRNQDWLADTASGKALGTLPFAAQEQLHGQLDVDGRADVYALARTALWVICGGHLPSGALEERIAFLAQMEIPDVLRQVLQRATEFHPADRYPDMDAFVEAFEQALHRCQSELLLPVKLPTSLPARKPSPEALPTAPPRNAASARSRRLSWLVLASLFANLGLFAIWRMLRAGMWPQAEAPPTAEENASRRPLGRQDTLPALNPGCDALSKARSQACTSAVGSFCRKEGFAGGIGQEIPLLSIIAGCIRGELASAAFEELARYVAACKGGSEAQSQACVTAASQYCLYMAGLTAGFIQDTDDKYARLLCFRGQRYSTSLAGFLPENPRCNAASISQHPFCVSAAHIYCAAQKTPDGKFYTGGIVTKANGETFEVACFSGALREVYLMFQQ